MRRRNAGAQRNAFVNLGGQGGQWVTGPNGAPTWLPDTMFGKEPVFGPDGQPLVGGHYEMGRQGTNGEQVWVSATGQVGGVGPSGVNYGTTTAPPQTSGGVPLTAPPIFYGGGPAQAVGGWAALLGPGLAAALTNPWGRGATPAPASNNPGGPMNGNGMLTNYSGNPIQLAGVAATGINAIYQLARTPPPLPGDPTTDPVSACIADLRKQVQLTAGASAIAEIANLF